MSYGNRLSTDSLLKSLESALRYARDDYENGRIGETRDWARQLMEGSMELWERMVEEDDGLASGGEGQDLRD